MSWTLEQFGAACQRALTEEPGPSGRKKVCEIVQNVLKDDAFIATYVGDDVPELLGRARHRDRRIPSEVRPVRLAALPAEQPRMR